jgi:hypothetical protein
MGQGRWPGIDMTYDELAVLEAIRSFPRGSRIPRQSVVDKARLPVERVNKALEGLDASGDVWLDGDKVRLGSTGTTFDT